MEPVVFLILLVVVVIAASVAVNRRRHRAEEQVALLVMPRHSADSGEPGDGPGGVHVRRDRAMKRERAAPADPVVAELAERIRDSYRVGRDSWNANAAGVRRELEAAGETGRLVAVWVVERAVADFRWELDFWAEEAGLPPAEPGMAAGERFARLRASAQPNPYSTPSGYHPRIHLVAAAEVLAETPRAGVAGPLADLLELWFAHAERQDNIHDLDIRVLETLTRCYRVTPVTDLPAFLVRLADAEVSTPVVNMDNVVSHVEDGITYVDPVFKDDGSYSLSALARAATSR